MLAMEEEAERLPEVPPPDDTPWEEFAKAYVHPMQLRVYALIRAKGTASPIELANELGGSLGRISHHIRSLERRGFLELVETRAVRGAIKHIYRAKLPEEEAAD